LSQHLKGGAFEFRQFIQEENAVVSEADLSGAGIRRPPEKARV
jgi:hypothetical protein